MGSQRLVKYETALSASERASSWRPGVKKTDDDVAAPGTNSQAAGLSPRLLRSFSDSDCGGAAAAAGGGGSS